MPRSEGFSEEPRRHEAHDENLRSVPYQRLKLDSAGRIVIPAEMRAAMMVKPGDMVTAEVVEGELRIFSRAAVHHRIDRAAARFKADNPGISVVDELVAERRQEARLELEDANAWRKAHGLPPFDAE